MKQLFKHSGMILLACGLSACAKTPGPDYPIKDVPMTAVKLTDGFWAERQKTDIAVTVRHNMKECEQTGRIKNFDLAAAALRGRAGGKLATAYPFDDSDVYKVIEATAYLLMLKPDPGLAGDLDVWIARIAAAQEPDGYLYTARTIDPAAPPEMSGPERWVNLYMSHELYNAGHMYEAAAAHFQATGRRNFLDVALKNADFIVKTFGPGEKQLKRVPGHEEIEIGLVKLYRLTGKKKYLDLAKFFIDQRGNASGRELYGEYSQDHKPVLEQDEAVGHAVRAAYLYSSMADIAALSGDPRYLAALDKIWEDVVSKKLYLTGGIGSTGGIEGFGPAYELGNETGYAETCATIAYALWNYRMFRHHGEAKYMDLFERAALNAFLSGAGMSGDLFFYPNPLASNSDTQRTPWFTCACCPPNVARFIAQMGGFAYAVSDDRVYVNLFASSTADIETKNGKVVLTQTTRYPWSGDVKIEVAPEKAAALTLMIRIPGWAQGRPLPGDLYFYEDGTSDVPSIKVNGEDVTFGFEKGYLPVERTWTKGDVVELSLPMPVRLVRANANVAADAGRIAVERGPLVYAAEFVDNGGVVSNLLLDPALPMAVEQRADLLNGVTVITGEATAYRMKAGREIAEKKTLTLIPYYAWAHRGAGEMEVWIAAEKEKVRPAGKAGSDYLLRPVPFTSVRLNDVFWAPKIETNRAVTVPFALRKNEETGRVDNFRKAAGLMKGAYEGKRYNDSDVFKVMEGAAYTLMLKPDPKLAATLDDLIAVIAKAQEPDGYLYTNRTIDPNNPAPGAGAERWSNLRVSHEFYNVGHMYEAAVAHFQATGKKSFLDIAVKNADLLVNTFGPGKRRAFPGHQEIEIGLSKLYRVTGNRAYLDLAKFFLDERGRYFQGERYAPDDPFSVYNSDAYLQNHKPVLEQDEAVGHAVRAMYMYAGMADVAALGGYPEYVAAIDRLWENVVGKKMYITGGVGARADAEAFGDAYELPNQTAYTETCASVGNALWQQRLFLLHGDAKYVDVLERVMYNGLISGVGLDGMSFFYQNPLEADGKSELYQGQIGRSPWFEVSCCPPNVLRFLPSVPGYVYAVRNDSLYVNLYMANTAVVDVAGTMVALSQETKYPWNGAVKITVSPEKGADFALLVRVPGWARNEPVPTDLYRFLDESDEKPALAVNGGAVEIELEKGYVVLRRAWKKGDTVELTLPMPVRRVVANAAVEADAGRVAFQRGPLVYCAEAVDNDGHVLDLSIMDGARFSAEFRPDLLNGVVVLKRETLRAPMRLGAQTVRDVMLIPYYAWANRGPGEMRVWFPRD